MQIFFLTTVCNIAAWQILLALLLPFLLGYLLRYFLDSGKKDIIAGLQAENDSMKKEVQAAGTYKSSFHHAEGEVKKMKASFTGMEADMSRLRAELDATAKKLKPYEGIDLQALHGQIADLSAANAKLHGDIEGMTGLSSNLEDATANANMLREKFASLEADNIRLKRELQQVTDAKNKIERSEANVNTLREDVRNLSGKLGGLTVENERLKAAAAEAKLMAGSNTGALDGLQQKLAAAEAATAATAARLAELEQKEKALEQATQQADAYKATADAQAAELKAMKEKLNDTEIDLSRARLKAEGLEAAAKNSTAADDMGKQIAALQASLAAAQQQLAASDAAKASLALELEALRNQPAPMAAAAPEPTPVPEAAPEAAAAPAAAPDDLKVVEGIGPKVEELLLNAGITTWRQLAGSSPDALRAILKGGGDRFAMLNPNSWPKQAGLLADGKMDEFNAYTDYLIAGVDPAEKAGATPEKIDDLKIVEGIGPKIEGLCNAAGIYSFEELAATPVDKLRQLLDDAGSRYQMHDPTTWPQQAQLAADGKMDELQALQDKLKGGRE